MLAQAGPKSKRDVKTGVSYLEIHISCCNHLTILDAPGCADAQDRHHVRRRLHAHYAGLVPGATPHTHPLRPPVRTEGSPPGSTSCPPHSSLNSQPTSAVRLNSLTQGATRRLTTSTGCRRPRPSSWLLRQPFPCPSSLGRPSPPLALSCRSAGSSSAQPRRLAPVSCDAATHSPPARSRLRTRI